MKLPEGLRRPTPAEFRRWRRTRLVGGFTAFICASVTFAIAPGDGYRIVIGVCLVLIAVDLAFLIGVKSDDAVVRDDS